MQPLEVLYEDPSLPSFPLPEGIAKLYGDFGFDDDAVVANFVASIDGVTAIPETENSSALISQKSEADRFVMGLLRAAADVVVIGAGTLRSHPRALWTAGRGVPDVADDLSELRRQLGRVEPEPLVAIVTASGRIDPRHPVLPRAKVFTTTEGGKALADKIDPDSIVTLESDGDEIPPRAVLDALRAQGFGPILVEGGPQLLGVFVRDGAVDELFLTLSPVLAGRKADDPRPGLIEGVELLPDRAVQARLVSLRRRDSYLFLRYRLMR